VYSSQLRLFISFHVIIRAVDQNITSDSSSILIEHDTTSPSRANKEVTEITASAHRIHEYPPRTTTMCPIAESQRWKRLLLL